MASLLASGCAFTVDENYIKGPDTGVTIQEPDAQAPDAATDASEVEPNGGDAGATDAELTTSDGGSDATAPACEGASCAHACSDDAECEGSEYCSQLRGTCAARCTDEAGCVGPLIGGYTQSLLNDGESVYWSTSMSGRDVAGMWLRDGALWSWNLRDEPVRITGGLLLPRPLFIADGQIYYLEGQFIPQRLFRAETTLPSTPELLAADVTHAWLAGDFVYWSVAATSSAELWRAPRDTLAPGRLASEQHEGWVGGNEQLVFHTETRGEAPSSYLIADALADLTSRRELSGPYYRFGDVTVQTDGSILYFRNPDYSDGALRLDLTHPEDATWFMPQTGGSYFFVQDGWVYWSAFDYTLPAFTQLYGRTHGALAATSAELLRTVHPQSSGGGIVLAFSVIGATMIYADAWEGRLFTRAAQPLPCAPALPCPAGLSCTASMLCE